MKHYDGLAYTIAMSLLASILEFNDNYIKGSAPYHVAIIDSVFNILSYRSPEFRAEIIDVCVDFGKSLPAGVIEYIKSKK